MFGGLDEHELEALLPFLDEKRFAKGDCILRQGEPNNSVFFILEGSVSITKNGEEDGSREREITRLHPGDSFGEMELIDIQCCAASVRCLSDTKVVTLSNGDLYALSKRNLCTYTMIILNLAREISRRLRKTDDLLAMLDAKDRDRS
jgi:CRP-like cAMP-binding protein